MALIKSTTLILLAITVVFNASGMITKDITLPSDDLCNSTDTFNEEWDLTIEKRSNPLICSLARFPTDTITIPKCEGNDTSAKYLDARHAAEVNINTCSCYEIFVLRNCSKITTDSERHPDASCSQPYDLNLEDSKATLLSRNIRYLKLLNSTAEHINLLDVTEFDLVNSTVSVLQAYTRGNMGTEVLNVAIERSTVRTLENVTIADLSKINVTHSTIDLVKKLTLLSNFISSLENSTIGYIESNGIELITGELTLTDVIINTIRSNSIVVHPNAILRMVNVTFRDKPPLDAIQLENSAVIHLKDIHMSGGTRSQDVTIMNNADARLNSLTFIVNDSYFDDTIKLYIFWPVVVILLILLLFSMLTIGIIMRRRKYMRRKISGKSNSILMVESGKGEVDGNDVKETKMKNKINGIKTLKKDEKKEEDDDKMMIKDDNKEEDAPNGKTNKFFNWTISIFQLKKKDSNTSVTKDLNIDALKVPADSIYAVPESNPRPVSLSDSEGSDVYDIIPDSTPKFDDGDNDEIYISTAGIQPLTSTLHGGKVGRTVERINQTRVNESIEPQSNKFENTNSRPVNFSSNSSTRSNASNSFGTKPVKKPPPIPSPGHVVGHSPLFNQSPGHVVGHSPLLNQNPVAKPYIPSKPAQMKSKAQAPLPGQRPVQTSLPSDEDNGNYDDLEIYDDIN